MSTPNLLVIGGSLRAESYNQKLAAIAAGFAREAGAEVALISLRDFRLPLFDEDLEEAEGKSEAAKQLKAAFVKADGFIIASPEYNSGITAALKNAIDWVSRADSDDESPLFAFKGKTAAIIAASPSGGGGVRSLAALRTLLMNIRVEVLTPEVTVPAAYEAFGDDGQLLDNAKEQELKELVAALVEKLSV